MYWRGICRTAVFAAPFVAALGMSFGAVFQPAFAQELPYDVHQERPMEGLYGSAKASWLYTDKIDYEWEFSKAEAGLSEDFGIIGAIGYRYPNGIRTEVELTLQDVRVRTVSSEVAAGKINLSTVMGNITYDVMQIGPVSPYIGAGVGWIYSDHNVIAGQGNGPGGGPTFLIDDNKSALAWQAIGGLSYRINDNFALDVSYRYFDSKLAEFYGAIPAGPVETEHQSHAVLFGLRWTFAQVFPN